MVNLEFLDLIQESLGEFPVGSDNFVLNDGQFKNATVASAVVSRYVLAI